MTIEAAAQARMIALCSGFFCVKTEGKKYQVRVRRYVTVDGQKYFGRWSKIKTIKKIK